MNEGMSGQQTVEKRYKASIIILVARTLSVLTNDI